MLEDQYQGHAWPPQLFPAQNSHSNARAGNLNSNANLNPHSTNNKNVEFANPELSGRKRTYYILLVLLLIGVFVMFLTVLTALVIYIRRESTPLLPNYPISTHYYPLFTSLFNHRGKTKCDRVSRKFLRTFRGHRFDARTLSARGEKRQFRVITYKSAAPIDLTCKAVTMP